MSRIGEWDVEEQGAEETDEEKMDGKQQNVEEQDDQKPDFKKLNAQKREKPDSKKPNDQKREGQNLNCQGQVSKAENRLCRDSQEEQGNVHHIQELDAQEWDAGMQDEVKRACGGDSEERHAQEGKHWAFRDAQARDGQDVRFQIGPRRDPHAEKQLAQEQDVQAKQHECRDSQASHTQERLDGEWLEWLTRKLLDRKRLDRELFAKQWYSQRRLVQERRIQQRQALEKLAQKRLTKEWISRHWHARVRLYREQLNGTQITQGRACPRESRLRARTPSATLPKPKALGLK
eukprot:scpid88542/ scgid32222/ 